MYRSIGTSFFLLNKDGTCETYKRVWYDDYDYTHVFTRRMLFGVRSAPVFFLAHRINFCLLNMISVQL